jgi:tRNA threonylcarbamoyladenosine biosynthesis protein TsaB
MYNLIIDTSTEKGVVAIADGINLVFIKELPAGLLNSRHLFSTIFIGFQSLGINPSHLASVSVSVGPGSFTGVRVGVSAAKGIALGRNLPLIGFDSLTGFISTVEGSFFSVIDARMNMAYVLEQRRVGNRVSSGTIELCSYDDLKKKLDNCLSIGPSFEKMGIENGIETYPNAEHLAKVTHEKFLRKEYSNEGLLDLIYLRNPV